MIGSIFFLTYSGELIAYKELIKFQQKVEPLKFCVSFKRNRKNFPKVIKSDGLFYVTCEQSEVAAVAVCRDETTNAFAVLTSLTQLCAVYQDLFAFCYIGIIMCVLHHIDGGVLVYRSDSSRFHLPSSNHTLPCDGSDVM